MPEFLQRFSVIWLAHIGPDDWALEPALHTRSPWRAALAFRQWRAGFNAGGTHKSIGKPFLNMEDFLNNYLFGRHIHWCPLMLLITTLNEYINFMCYY